MFLGVFLAGSFIAVVVVAAIACAMAAGDKEDKDA